MDHPTRHEPTIELAVGSLSQRGQCCTISELPQYIERCRNANAPLFRSWYVFTNGLRDHFKLAKTIKGYRGPVAVDDIILDIDRGSLTDEQALLRTRAFIERITTELPLTDDCFQVWFSGTGYHVQMKNVFGFPEGVETPALVKDTLTHYFPEADVIYDRARLIRVGGTVNEKSKLYKIPLTQEELFGKSWQEIHALAASPREDFVLPELSREQVLETMQRKVLPIQAPKPYIVAEKSTNFVTCTQEMYLRGPIDGERHQAMLRIASARRRGGNPFEVTVRDLQAWAPALPPDDVERLVKNVYTTPLEYSCRDPYMLKFCSDKCMFYKYKNFGSSLATPQAMELEFLRFVETGISAHSFTMREVFPSMAADYRFNPGELVVVIGDTKVGKTAFVQNLCVKMNRLKTLYVSLEVGQNLMYRRFVQIAHDMSKSQVEEHYRLHKGERSLVDPIQHIIVGTVPSTAIELLATVKSVNPQIVVIDTTDGLKTRFRHDPVAASNDIALELRDLATNTGTIVIAIHHISKGSLKDPFGKPQALNVHSGKGSSTLEQKADKIIGIELTPAKDAIIRSLAARDDGDFTLTARMNPLTFRFQEIP